MAAAGCAPWRAPPPPCPTVPAAWLEPCRLPAAPDTTGELADAFVQVVQCVEQLNRDKAAIRSHIMSQPPPPKDPPP